MVVCLQHFIKSLISMSISTWVPTYFLRHSRCLISPLGTADTLNKNHFSSNLEQLVRTSTDTRATKKSITLTEFQSKISSRSFNFFYYYGITYTAHVKAYRNK